MNRIALIGTRPHWKDYLNLVKLGRNQARSYSFLSRDSQKWRSILLNTPLTPKDEGCTYQFYPNFAKIDSIPSVISYEDLSNERSMFSATIDFARKNGGPLTHTLLDKIPTEFFEIGKRHHLYPNLDVRVQNYDTSILEECDGDALYPAVPGWHCDGEFRETYFGQPDLLKVPISFHIIATASTTPNQISNTHFLNEPLRARIERATEDYTFWSQVHHQVENMHPHSISEMKDGEITLFDARTLHTATRVRRSGGRIFFRMSHWHKPNLEVGKLGKHEQIYLTSKRTYCSHEHENHMRKHAGKGFFDIMGSTTPYYTIGELDAEKGMIHASAHFLNRHGGVIAKKMLNAVPPDYLLSLVSSGLQPRFDILIFRLYPGYTPLPPKQNGVPMPRGWKLGIHGSHPEIIISASSAEKGVSHTEILTPELLKIPDGVICCLSKDIPRRETPALNRGWSLFFRAYGVKENACSEGTLVTQQYVDPMSEATGW